MVYSLHHPLGNERSPIDWRNTNNLNVLSTLENFPDHLIRKALGKEKALPCPDSKFVVREVFRNLRRPWKIRTELQPSFDKVIESSGEYDVLISKRKKLTQMNYEEGLGKIANNILKITEEILNRISANILDFFK